jgi:multiple sugar transport system permease protein
VIAQAKVRNKANVRKWSRRTVLIVAGTLIVFWSLAPIYWGLVVSLDTPGALNVAHMSFIPHPFTLSNYSSILNGSSAISGAFLTALRNSAIEAAGTALVTVVTAVLAAFAFARWRFVGSSTLFIVILATLALPVYAILIPLYQFASRLHEVNTFQAIILITVSSTLPLSIWILRSHIASLPLDIEDAARVDGASWWAVLWRVVTPLIAPGMAVATLIAFLAAWASFLIPLTFAATPFTEPLTVIIPNFTTRYSTDYGLQAASGIVALVPPVVLVIWLNRYLIRGLLMGAVNQ